MLYFAEFQIKPTKYIIWPRNEIEIEQGFNISFVAVKALLVATNYQNNRIYRHIETIAWTLPVPNIAYFRCSFAQDGIS